jgi:hypothetical protein
MDARGNGALCLALFRSSLPGKARLETREHGIEPELEFLLHIVAGQKARGLANTWKLLGAELVVGGPGIFVRGTIGPQLASGPARVFTAHLVSQHR